LYNILSKHDLVGEQVYNIRKKL